MNVLEEMNVLEVFYGYISFMILDIRFVCIYPLSQVSHFALLQKGDCCHLMEYTVLEDEQMNESEVVYWMLLRLVIVLC